MPLMCPYTLMQDRLLWVTEAGFIQRSYRWFLESQHRMGGFAFNGLQLKRKWPSYAVGAHEARPRNLSAAVAG